MDRISAVNKAIGEICAGIELLAGAYDEKEKNDLLNYLRCKAYGLYLLNNCERKPLHDYFG